jgi:microcompartment protein CcmL/EutN
VGAQAIDFSDLGGTVVAPPSAGVAKAIDFSDLGGKMLQRGASQPSQGTPVQQVRYMAPGQGVQEFTQGSDEETAFLKRFPQAKQIPIPAGAGGKTTPSYTVLTDTPYQRAEAARDAESERRSLAALKTGAIAFGATVAPELIPEIPGAGALPWLARVGARATASGVGAGTGNVAGQVAEGENPLTSENLEETGKVTGTTAAIAAPLEAAAGALSAWKAARAVKALGQPTEDFTAAIPPSKSAAYTPDDYQAARPHLEAEHSASPIKSVQDLRDASDSAIKNIEDKIDGHIQANPKARISTNPLQDVRQALATNARGKSFADAGLADLKDFQLDQPKTLQQADAIRWQLNQENKAILQKNSYSVATARAIDPAFAAREAAAESLRNGIYDGLEQLGIPDARDLRQVEGSIIKIRNAAQNQVFSGAGRVGGTGTSSATRQAIKAGIKTAATGVGAQVGGVPGAVIGSTAGERVGQMVAPGNLTRDALIERSFSVPAASTPQTTSAAPSQVVRFPKRPQLVPNLATGTMAATRGRLADMQ